MLHFNTTTPAFLYIIPWLFNRCRKYTPAAKRQDTRRCVPEITATYTGLLSFYSGNGEIRIGARAAFTERNCMYTHIRLEHHRASRCFRALPQMPAVLVHESSECLKKAVPRLDFGVSRLISKLRRGSPI